MVSSLFGPWSSYFEITGSSAAALTGLMFVVVSLVMGLDRRRRAPTGTTVFSTPTVMHFCFALLFSGVLVAPWPVLACPAVLVAIAALFGVVYIARIALLAKQFTEYIPDREDWLWYTLLPFVAYLVALAGAVALPFAPRPALFALAASVMMLIFIGIHNAWDVVTYLALGNMDQGSPEP